MLYGRANKSYYARSTIMITVTMFLIALIMQVLGSMATKTSPSSNLVTIVAWAGFLIFLLLCVATRKYLLVQRLVCPLLTIYVTVIAVFGIEGPAGEAQRGVDVDGGMLFARAMIMTAALFYVLAMFNELWLVNLIVFTVCSVCALIKATSSLGNDPE